MSDLVDLIANGDVQRPADKTRKPYSCTHCHERGHSVRTCPGLGRVAAPRHASVTITEAERAILDHAARIADGLVADAVAIAPRHGQHPAFNRLRDRGLLADAGRGVRSEDHALEVDLYAITDAGRAALRETK